jgi:hypothetical protein
MSSGVPLNSARRTVTYAAAELVDVDGVMAGGATSLTEDTLLAADFVGAAMTTGGILDLPRSIIIVLGNNAGAFEADEPWVLTGKRGGVTVTAEFTPTTANGNETLRDPQAFDSLISLVIPAQPDDDGTYTIGVQDICAPIGDTFTAIKLDTAGPLNVAFDEAGTAMTDMTTVLAGDREPIAAKRILTNTALATPTVSALTLYLP